MMYQYVQAIRQWDQALRERNDYRDALAKVQRQHEEAVKEINQAMAIRLKVGRHAVSMKFVCIFVVL